MNLSLRNPSDVSPPSSSGSEPTPRALVRAIIRLSLAQVMVLSLWFSVAAVLPALAAHYDIEVQALAHLSTATQIGFVIGALILALSGMLDRFDPRRVFVCCALLAAAANLVLLGVEPAGRLAWGSRLVVGAGLAGVYPVGLKLAVGWTRAHRGLVVSSFVGALTFGSSSPNLVALVGGADAAWTLGTTSLLALTGAVMVYGFRVGPFHAVSPAVRVRDVGLAFTHLPLRRAYLGYLAHMWELYAFWAWIGVAATQIAANAGLQNPTAFGSGLAFAAIALGAFACVPAGWVADRVGKRKVARSALFGSLAAGLATALSVEQSMFLFSVFAILWGITIIPDSPQFSALVADHAPADKAGSLMAFQTALGFALTAVSVQILPALAEEAGWGIAFASLALGPLVGVWAMRAPRNGAH